MSNLLGKSFKYYRFYYSIFSLLNLAALLYFQFTIYSPAFWKISGLLQFIFLLTGATGLFIMILCMRKYFSHVTGIKAFSRGLHQKSVLRTDGLHSYTRHPLYFGTLLCIWSFCLLFPFWSNLVACGLISVYTIAGIHIEERKLINEFGESYRSYARKVPKLIPRLFVMRTKIRHTFPETAQRIRFIED